jgi:ABC-2 type transport system permease protein
MAKFWVVFKREYLERVRSRWFVFATILGPVVFGTIIIGSAVLSEHATVSADASHVIVLDATGTDLGARVVGNLGGGITGDTSTAVLRVITPATRAQAESIALHDVMRGDHVGYVVLDDHTLDGTRVHYAGRNASAIPDVQHVQETVRQAVLTERLAGAGLDPRRIAALTTVPMSIDAIRVTEHGAGGSGMSGAFFGYMVALLLYMMIVLYGQSILRGVTEEKSTRVAEVVVASAPPETLLAGKIFGTGGVALTQEFIWVVASAAIVYFRAPILKFFHASDVPLPLPSITPFAALALLLIFILGFFLYAALYAAVGATVDNQEDAQQASLPLMLLLICSTMFIGPVWLSPTSTLARVTSWLPFSAPILMPLRMSITQVSPLEIAGTIAGLALSCALAIWAAARIYRVGLLMYGKRRSLGEIVRWLRA